MTTNNVKNSQCYIKMKKIYTYLYIGAIRSYVHLFHDRPLVLSMHWKTSTVRQLWSLINGAYCQMKCIHLFTVTWTFNIGANLVVLTDHFTYNYWQWSQNLIHSLVTCIWIYHVSLLWSRRVLWYPSVVTGVLYGAYDHVYSIMPSIVTWPDLLVYVVHIYIRKL